MTNDGARTTSVGGTAGQDGVEMARTARTARIAGGGHDGTTLPPAPFGSRGRGSRVWMVPVARGSMTPALPPATEGEDAAGVDTLQRRVELQVLSEGFTRVIVDGRVTLHEEIQGEREGKGKLRFWLGGLGCEIEDDARGEPSLRVGGRVQQRHDSTRPVASTSARLAEPEVESTRALALSPRWIALLGVILVGLLVWKGLVAVYGKPAPWQPAWREVAAAGGGFSVRLPADPIELVETRKEQTETFTTHELAAEVPGAARFSAGYVDFPAAALSGERYRQIVCAVLLEERLNKARARVSSITLPAITARSVATDGAMTTCSLKGGIDRPWRFRDLLRSHTDLLRQGLDLELRGYVSGGRMWFVAAEIEPDHAGNPDVAAFFQSFRLAQGG